MIKHLFRLIWNKRKQNFLLMFEMLISFLVIFSVFTLMIYYFINYKSPLGFDHENVWAINFNNAEQFSTDDSARTYYEAKKQNIKGLKQVREVSYASGNIPFSNNTMQNGIRYNNVEHQHSNLYFVEPSYKEVLNIKVIEGRWFDKQDYIGKRNHIVINQNMKELLFGNGTAVGKILGMPDNPELVIGVIEGIKQKGDYYDAGISTFHLKDTSNKDWGLLLVKVSPDADATFEGKLYKTMAGLFKNSNIEIEHLQNKRKDINYYALVPIVTTAIVACFLIINVALGLFGVLWYNISRRRGEIGLRRAVGASGGSVSGQLISESMILTTISLIVGSFFAIQFPLLHVFDLPANIYLFALLLAILFIYFLVFICSLYPGRQAAAVYPAVALHED